MRKRTQLSPRRALWWPGLRSMLVLLLGLAPLLLASCDDAGPSAPFRASAPDAALRDGSTDGAYDGFLFLPPMVGHPDLQGQTPLPGLDPTVVICLLDVAGTACETDYHTFGPADITFETDHYQVDWDTHDPAYPELAISDPNGATYTYRLAVYLGPLELGFVDLQFGENGGTAKNLTTDEIVGLKDGRTVPVNFFIGDFLETDLGCTAGLDCRIATFPAGQEVTLLTRDGDAVLYLPGGATSGSGEIVARIAEVEPGQCDLGVALPWYNSCYEYDLWPDQTLQEPAIVAQCIETASVPAGRLRELQLGARHDDPPAGVPGFELLPNVVSPATLSCDDYTPGPDPSGLAAVLSGATRTALDFLFGEPAFAGHTGLGGSVRDFSTIAWVDPGLRVAGLSTARAGWSSIDSDYLAPAMDALRNRYPTVWAATADALDATLLDEEVDVVLLGSVFDGQNVPMAPLDAAEQAALHTYVEHGGCVILLADNAAFASANASLLSPFGLSVTSTLGGDQTATTQGTSGAVDGVASLIQFYPGWFNGTGQADVLATNDGNGQPVYLEATSDANGSYAGRVFATSDANMFMGKDGWAGGRFAQNTDLFLNTVDACGTEPLPSSTGY